MTPFGKPVVPLEYGSATMSRAESIVTAGGLGGDCSSSANGRVPSAVPNTKISLTALFAAASFALSRNAGIVTRMRAPQSAICLAASSAVYSGLIVVLAPPSDATALKQTAYSGMFGL